MIHTTTIPWTINAPSTGRNLVSYVNQTIAIHRSSQNSKQLSQFFYFDLILRDHVQVEALIVYEIAPSGSGVDSSRNSSWVDRVLVETLIVKRIWVKPWIDMCSRNCYGVGTYYNFIPMFLDTTLYYIVTLSL